MANIKYTLSSSFLPMFVTLRQNDVSGTIVDSKVLQTNVVDDLFTGVTVGTYAVVGYDSAFGSDSSILPAITTTTIAPLVKFSGGANNKVNSIIETSMGNYLIGGTFTGYTDSVGLTETNGVIRLKSADGDKDTVFGAPTGASGTSGIGAVRELINGEYLIMGAYDEYSGATHEDMTNVNADGSFVGGWSPWNGNTPITRGINGAILVPTTKYLIFGGFRTLNTDADQVRASKVSTNGSFDGGFSTDGTSFGSTVYDAVLTSGGTYLFVGSFQDYNGTTYNRIAVLNTDGTINVGESTVFGTGFNGSVFSIILTSTNQYLVGGSFSSYNGTTSNNIILLNLDGSVDATFNIGTGFNGNVFSAIETSDGKYLVGGAFTTYNGSPRNRIIKLNTNGSIDSSFDVGGGSEGLNAQIDSKLVETSDGYYLVGGQFTQYKGNSHNCIVKINTSGTAIW